MKLEFCEASEIHGKSCTRWLADQKEEITVQQLGGRIIAFSSTCPHNGGNISVSKGRLRCPWHGAEFDQETGNCQNAKLKSLKIFRAELSAGKVWVEIENS